MKIKETIYFNFDWIYGVSIKKMKDDLDALEKLGVTEINIEPVDNYGSCSVNIEAFKERDETNKERKERLKAEKERNERIKNYELQQLDMLQKKYNK